MSRSPIGLIPIDRACAALIARDAAEFDALHGVDSDGVREQLASVIGMTPADMLAAGDWGTFFAYESETRRIVGSCGFKARPNPHGTVEIAYFTFAPFEGRGFATAMASDLVVRALSSIEAADVIAHTLPQDDASTRVLIKCAFQHVGEILDPEDGPVWRWRYGP
jgi:RimJ/RimL family protein N-acetyltransferase